MTDDGDDAADTDDGPTETIAAQAEPPLAAWVELRVAGERITKVSIDPDERAELVFTRRDDDEPDTTNP